MPYSLSHTAFAKVAGISRGRVSQLVAEGLPVDQDGRIDPKAGLAWIATHIDPDRRRDAGFGTPAGNMLNAGFLPADGGVRGSGHAAL